MATFIKRQVHIVLESLKPLNLKYKVLLGKFIFDLLKLSHISSLHELHIP